MFSFCSRQPYQDTNSRTQDVVDLIHDAAIVIDLSGQVVAANRELQSVFCCPPQSVVGGPLSALIPERYQLAQKLLVYQRTASDAVIRLGAEARLFGLRPDGSELPLEITAKVIAANGDLMVVLSFRDISKLVYAEQQLRYLTKHDPLTGFGNRSSLIKKIGHLMRSHNSADEMLSTGSTGIDRASLIIIGLDRFRQVNDSLGQESGDHLLRAAAQQIGTCCGTERGDTPSCSLYRLGGAEFAVLLQDVGQTCSVTRFATELKAVLGIPHHVAGHKIKLSPCIGVLSSLTGYAQAEQALRDAGLAMRRAMKSGGDRAVVFEKQMSRQPAENVSIQSELLTAIEQDELELFYQPVIDLETGSVAGLESLVQWNHPKLGRIRSDRFMSIAEEAGLTIPISQWAIGRACHDFSCWAGVDRDSDRFVSVNLSKRGVMHPELIAISRRAMQTHGLSRGQLRCEIPEDTVVSNYQSILPQISALKDSGLGICMDRFGSGDSSLSSLHEYPVDTLKIDRSFVFNIDRRREYAAILQAIVTLAHNLDMKVIADGVQTMDQVAELQALDCDQAQGEALAVAVDRAGLAEVSFSSRRPQAAGREKF